MNSMTLNFTEFPLWLRKEEASKLVKSIKLKELRENRKIRFRTIEGKLCYPLTDVLKYAGVNDIITYGETPIEVPDLTTKPLESTPVVESKAGEDETQDRRFFFCDLFTYESDVLPKDSQLPIFRIRKVSSEYVYQHTIEGKIVDIQLYKAQTTGVYPKIRFILQSLTNPNNYLILQTRVDKYHASFFADLITETIMSSQDLANKITINIGTTETKKSYFKITHNGMDYEFINPDHYQLSISIETIFSKAIAALKNMKEQGKRQIILTETSDKNFISSLIKPQDI